MSGREAWLATRLPHQVPPAAEEWDLWTLWGDRACGKTRAALEEALEWCRHGAETRVGRPGPARVGIFVRDVRDGMANALYGPNGLASLSEIEMRIDSLRDRVELANGSQIQFYPFADAPRSRCMGLTHGIVEDAERATPRELDEIMRCLNGELKWAPAPRIILTCHILPGWPVHRLAGGRNHLTIIPSVAQNPHVAEALVREIERSRP